MHYLIAGDMHGNWDALNAVLEHTADEVVDRVLVLGDLVGYGASPNEVVQTIRELPVPYEAIRGNHDKVVAGIDTGENFNPTALLAARWTTETLAPDNMRFVTELVQGPLPIETDLTICHGSLVDEDEYLLSSVDAMDSFASSEGQVTFFGHTHIPSMFLLRDGRVEVSVLEGDELVLDLEPGVRYLLNPGSVGQPRDRDPRAGYMLFDSVSRQVVARRIDYPIDRAQERIRQAGLPDILADRLSVGI